MQHASLGEETVYEHKHGAHDWKDPPQWGGIHVLLCSNFIDLFEIFNHFWSALMSSSHMGSNAYIIHYWWSLLKDSPSISHIYTSEECSASVFSCLWPGGRPQAQEEHANSTERPQLFTREILHVVQLALNAPGFCEENMFALETVQEETAFTHLLYINTYLMQL